MTATIKLQFRHLIARLKSLPIDTNCVYQVISDLFTGSAQLVRFEYEGNALQPMKAAMRVNAGQTVDSMAKGFINLTKDEPIAFLQVGRKKDNLNVLMKHAMGSRKDDGSYDWRAYTIASPLNGRKVESIEVCFPGRSWETIDLDQPRIFPLIPESDTEMRELLAQALLYRARLEAEEAILDKEKKRLQSQFSKWRKTNPNGYISNVDGIVRYFPPSGTTTRVVNENGNSIKTEAQGTSDNLVKLIPFDYVPDEDEDFINPLEGLEVETEGRSKGRVLMAELPSIYRRMAIVGDEIRKINNMVRPYELGLIEAERDSPVFLNLNEFKIVRDSETKYDLPKITSKMLEQGKWKSENVPVSKGQTKYIEA